MPRAPLFGQQRALRPLLSDPFRAARVQGWLRPAHTPASTPNPALPGSPVVPSGLRLLRVDFSLRMCAEPHRLSPVPSHRTAGDQTLVPGSTCSLRGTRVCPIPAHTCSVIPSDPLLHLKTEPRRAFLLRRLLPPFPLPLCPGMASFPRWTW